MERRSPIWHRLKIADAVQQHSDVRVGVVRKHVSHAAGKPRVRPYADAGGARGSGGDCAVVALVFRDDVAALGRHSREHAVRCVSN